MWLKIANRHLSELHLPLPRYFVTGVPAKRPRLQPEVHYRKRLPGKLNKVLS